MTWALTRGVVSAFLLENFVGHGGESSLGDSGLDYVQFEKLFKVKFSFRGSGQRTKSCVCTCAPLFHRDTRRVIGINVSVALLAPGDSLEVTYRARVSSHGCFLSLYVIEKAMIGQTSRPFLALVGYQQFTTSKSLCHVSLVVVYNSLGHPSLTAHM